MRSAAVVRWPVIGSGRASESLEKRRNHVRISSLSVVSYIWRLVVIPPSSKRRPFSVTAMFSFPVPVIVGEAFRSGGGLWRGGAPGGGYSAGQDEGLHAGRRGLPAAGVGCSCMVHAVGYGVDFRCAMPVA